jgi:hypothetical protein
VLQRLVDVAKTQVADPNQRSSETPQERCAKQLTQAVKGCANIARPRGVDMVPTEIVMPQRGVTTAACGCGFQFGQPLVTQREPTAKQRGHNQVREQIGTRPHGASPGGRRAASAVACAASRLPKSRWL